MLRLKMDMLTIHGCTVGADAPVMHFADLVMKFMFTDIKQVHCMPDWHRNSNRRHTRSNSCTTSQVTFGSLPPMPTDELHGQLVIGHADVSMSTACLNVLMYVPAMRRCAGQADLTAAQDLITVYVGWHWAVPGLHWAAGWTGHWRCF